MSWQYQTENRKWTPCSAWLAGEIERAKKPGDDWEATRWVPAGQPAPEPVRIQCGSGAEPGRSQEQESERGTW